MKSNSLLPLILCGGSGSRLWPLSRASFPKQFLSLLGNNKASLLQETQLRLKNLKNIQNPILICNEEHRFIVAEQMREINVLPKSILLEPFGKNTAPAILTSAFKAIEDGDDPNLLILSADHNIRDVEHFLLVIEKAIQYSENGNIVTFGIVPNSPETGYGYIKAENSFEENLEASRIIKFLEKPDLKIAKELIKDKRFYWNSGIFMAKASSIIKECDTYCAGLSDLCKESLEANLYDLDFQRIKKDSFIKCPNISIDKAIMEKTELGMVMPLDAGWSDIGSWKTVWEVSSKDDFGNVLAGKIINYKTRNCLIKSDKKLVVGIGIEDLIIVDTNDAVLVANKNDCQQVKNIVNQLKNKGIDVGTNHQTIYRPWGSYTSIAKGDNWQLKTIEVKPGGKLSLQLHNFRSEHWVIVKGIAQVQIDNNHETLEANQSVYIPLGSKHRLSNPGKTSLLLIEVQSGTYLGEDDIVRFEDIYGRDKN